MKSKGLWIVVIIVVVLFGFYLFGSFFFSNILISRPTQSLAASQDSMSEYGVPTIALPDPEAVSIEIDDEVTLSGNYYENPLDGGCAVLLLHGYTSTRYGTLQYAPLFWERGCHLLAYDARGHGESSNSYHTYGYHEKTDGLAAFEWLKQRTDLPSEKIALSGVSYGAATSLQMLPLAPEAAFVLADSPYESLEVIVEHQAVEQFGNWVSLFVPGAFFVSEFRADFDKDVVSPKDAVVDIETPVLLIHSKTDGFTPFTHSEAIYANSNQATTELNINEWGSEHAGDIITDYDAYDEIVDRFLTEFAPEFGINGGR